MLRAASPHRGTSSVAVAFLGGDIEHPPELAITRSERSDNLGVADDLGRQPFLHDGDEGAAGLFGEGLGGSEPQRRFATHQGVRGSTTSSTPILGFSAPVSSNTIVHSKRPPTQGSIATDSSGMESPSGEKN